MGQGDGMVKKEKKIILIVEDDPKNIKLFRDVLRFKGYLTLEAGDGMQCLELAREHRPDLILMDMHLPVLDGLEATKRLKRDEQTKDIAVIAMTAYAMSGDRERILAAGCQDYISKPVHIPDFLVAVAKYLNEGDDGFEPSGGSSHG
jgi:CheY-like chemotaxis protein